MQAHENGPPAPSRGTPPSRRCTRYVGHAEASGEQFGLYRLLQRLGYGGMAEVWKAEWSTGDDLHVTVALKRVLPHLCDQPTVVEMFLNEARLARLLRHPNIPRTLDGGSVDGHPYFAMELVDGCDLYTLLRQQQRRLPIAAGVYITRELCQALAHAHTLTDEEGKPLELVHRDVSLSNVMLGRNGAVKLLDFGIAKVQRAPAPVLTRTGVLKGKFGYMAPEVMDGGPCDQRADLFAVGVVLHELLTGARLFRADTDYTTAALNRRCQVKPPSLANREVPLELDRIALRALARTPDKRYASAAELVEDLERVLVQQPWSRTDQAELMRSWDGSPARAGRPVTPETMPARVKPPTATGEAGAAGAAGAAAPGSPYESTMRSGWLLAAGGGRRLALVAGGLGVATLFGLLASAPRWWPAAVRSPTYTTRSAHVRGIADELRPAAAWAATTPPGATPMAPTPPPAESAAGLAPASARDPSTSLESLRALPPPATEPAAADEPDESPSETAAHETATPARLHFAATRVRLPGPRSHATPAGPRPPSHRTHHDHHAHHAAPSPPAPAPCDADDVLDPYATP